MELQDKLLKRYSPQAAAFKRIIGNYVYTEQVEKILVIGCGRGFETISLKNLFLSQIYGVDIDQQFDPAATEIADLINYDGEILPFSDNYFDLVYSFHVLEHVDNVEGMLMEMKRVLKPEGWVYIGVPNRSRILGYFGMKDKSLSQKIKQNLKDWQLRLSGRFKNRYGAHAGFTAKELYSLMNKYSNVQNVTNLYYCYKRPIFKYLLLIPGFKRYILPSLYMLATK